MRFRIDAPGQPTAYGDYLDEAEARSVVRRSGLVEDMSQVTVTPIWPDALMTETEMAGKMQPVEEPPGDDSPITSRLKGRLMQAAMDMYRLDNCSTARMRELLVREIAQLEELIAASPEMDRQKDQP